MAQLKSKFLTPGSIDASRVAADVATQSELDAVAAAKLNASEKGAASGVAPLNASSKIDIGYLPGLALTDVHSVSSEAAQLALVAQEGDIAIRSDLGKTFVHNGGIAGTMADWSEMISPAAPVSSVNSKTGAVVLSTTDIGEGTNLYYTQARFDTSFGGKSTSGLAEGTNLYHTEARARAAIRRNKEKKVLAAADITNQYIDLAQSPAQYSVRVVIGGLEQSESLDGGLTGDYTVTGNRVAFKGDLATGGSAALVAGDELHVQYEY